MKYKQGTNLPDFVYVAANMRYLVYQKPDESDQSLKIGPQQNQYRTTVPLAPRSHCILAVPYLLCTNLETWLSLEVMMALPECFHYRKTGY